MASLVAPEAGRLTGTVGRDAYCWRSRVELCAGSWSAWVILGIYCQRSDSPVTEHNPRGTDSVGPWARAWISVNGSNGEACRAFREGSWLVTEPDWSNLERAACCQRWALVADPWFELVNTGLTGLWLVLGSGCLSMGRPAVFRTSWRVT